MWASSQMSRKHSQIRLHTSACGLRARCAQFRPTLQASEHCRTIRYERRSWLRQEDGLPQRPQFCPQDTPLPYQGTINKQFASKTVANNAWVYPHVNRTIVRASRSVNLNRFVLFEFVPVADESEEGPCGFLGRLDMPIIDAAPNLAQVVHNSNKTGVQLRYGFPEHVTQNLHNQS